MEKASKEMNLEQKKLIIILFVAFIVVLLLFFGYKFLMLNRFKTDNIELNTASIFNEALDVEGNLEEEYEKIEFDGMSIKKYFYGYEDNENNPDIKVKYNEKKEVMAFYILSSLEQYTKLLSSESLVLYSDNENAVTDVSKTDKLIKRFLDKNEIENDIDLLNYVKDNYYLKNNIFTLSSKMKTNYTINTFIQVAFPEFESVTLLTGKNNGYIVNTNNGIREIHILRGDKQYIITLSGKEITNAEFIKNLLVTVEFN